MSTPPPPPATPSLSLPWRFSSSLIMGLTGSLSRGFLFGLNRTEVVGLDRFLETLDSRKNVEGRARGLITVSNHVSVIDDPLIWGVLPFKYAFSPSNHRWSLGSYDICFQNKFLSSFFSYGQVLPTHRGDYSPIHGGLFQPTITQAIRLLSSQPFTKTLSTETSPTISDPFSGGSLTYSTTGTDIFPAPSAYPSRRHSWVHIFPEGRVHQHPTKSLRYFKWGVSRLILESEPLPDIIPIFIDGNQYIMHESREWPRFVPRVGRDVKIAFGEKVDGEKVFGELRARWKRLVKLQKDALVKKGLPTDLEMGDLSEGLKYCSEAVALRKEVTRRIRLEVLKVRRELGYPDEDPKEGLVETWIEEGGKKTGKMEDGSYIGET
ncbi:Lysophosphatidylcholine acyltransferase [Lachnellula hyalina]|uniref:Tafazzin family protein n=1 Tax=Lachnellula hyalina TaxID=1316788 RepID=A0A8H8R1Y5_9HELO|nr:Lysophosphatidylcholine acyltransferase [Lachnellula hyalina]TVY25950.1 Lysophosphatidylcholine acyltransferase [Lachnellula hyalina]